MLAPTNSDVALRRVGRSGEDYLEAVLVLGREQRAVRVKDVAERLGVSRPSVVSALAKLERQGLVRHERYGAVELTADGAKVAASVDGRHKLLFSFLHETLGLPAAKASVEACALEHALSPQTTARLVRLVDQYRRLTRERGRSLRSKAARGR
ncbi:metal-dependent transcriptional regulator [candidate division WOR-3 bacterium]|nr:metal-dependent transcriptional regulator [candidate division WOR-3 bacterium]